MPWRPGQQPNRALETPFEDLPDHLYDHVLKWMERQLSSSRELTRWVGLTMRLPLPDVTSNHAQAMNMVINDAWTDSDVALDLLEVILSSEHVDLTAITDLKQILDQGHSAYRVRDDMRGLEMRLTPGIREQVEAVVNAAGGSAGDHLTNAWNDAYGRTPDAVKSYSESIKPVEAALAPRISPQNQQQTLGTMIRDVAAKPEKWRFSLFDGGVEMVLQMMRALWDGQTSRHGGVRPTREETAEEAQAALHIAAALVQYGVSGAFNRS